MLGHILVLILILGVHVPKATCFGTSVSQPFLPEKILLAYTYNNCQDLNEMHKVTQAVRDGINVLIWVFLSFETCPMTLSTTSSPRPLNCEENELLQTQLSQNKENLISYQNHLRDLGYGHLIHLVALGGWNGPHLPAGYTGAELYKSFQKFNQYEHQGLKRRLFDGIDWDLEGNDNVNSPLNEFTKECLTQMGDFSELAHKDGLIVSMAPPESYLDIFSQRFSRFVNLTYPEDDWHHDFRHHGRNAYAYLLAKHNHVFSFIFLQFYESYSHVAYQISHIGKLHHEVLIEYLQKLEDNGYGLFVNFEDDAMLDLPSQFVPLDPNKFILGFANGWAVNSEKTVFFKGNSIQTVFEWMSRHGETMPRGVGFWVIEEEGTNDVYYARELQDALSNYYIDVTDIM